MRACVCVFVLVQYACVHWQSSNPVFTVTPQQLMSSVEAPLVSEACVHVYYSVCVVSTWCDFYYQGAERLVDSMAPE